MNWILDSWLRWLAPVTSWRGFCLLFAVCVACVWMFQWRNAKMAPAMTPDGQMLKLDYDGLLEVLNKMGSHRKFYALSEVTLDLLFPFCYTALLSVPVLLGIGTKQGWLTLVPLLAGCMDLVENFTLAWLASWGQLGDRPWLAHVALWAGKIKTVLIYVSLVLAAVALITAFIKWITASRL